MLISFTLENYRSFKDRYKIICIPSNKLKKYPNNIQNNKQCNYLKVISLYGANASGKSNIIKALRSMRNLLCYEKEFNMVLAKEYEPFAYDESMKDKPTFFEVELLLNSQIVKYSIKFDKNKVHEEFLEEYIDDKYEKILSYTEHDFYYDIKYSDYSSALIKDLKINEDSKDNNKQQSTLFKILINNNKESVSELKTSLNIPDEIDLQAIVQNFAGSFTIRPIVKKSLLKFRGLVNVDDKIAINIQKWFMHKLTILDVEFDNMAKDIMRFGSLSFGEILLETQKDLVNSDKSLKNRIIHFISDADLSIKYIYSKKNISGTSNKSYDFFSQHKFYKKDGTVETTPMNFFQSESIGTQRLLAFSYHIIDTIDNGGLLLIDELDRSFHPLLVSYIISYFNSPDTNPKGGQLIFTTHASELLRISKLRLDQILFVSKDGMEHSDIYPLYKYKSESDDDKQYNLADEYLFGRFGGIPILPSGYNFGE